MPEWMLITQVGAFSTTRTIQSFPVGVAPARALQDLGLLREDAISYSIDGRLVSAARLAEPALEGMRVVAVERPSNAFSLFQAGLAALNPFQALSNAQQVLSLANPYYSYSALNYLRSSLIPALPEGADSGTRTSAVDVRNRLRKHEPVVQVLGRHRLHPDQAAQTYVEVVGNNLYQRILLTCGPGRVVFEDLRIGNDPVFAEGTVLSYTQPMTGDGNFDDIQVEFREGFSSEPPIRLFSRNHVSSAVGVQLTSASGWVVRRTPENVTEITAIMAYPGGLSFTNSRGKLQKATVRTQVEYRSADADPDDPWTSAGQLQTTARATRVIYDKRRWTVSEGQYDVRMKRVTGPPALGVVDRSDWHSLQCLRAGAAVTRNDLSLIAIYVRLTDRFASIIENVNVIASSVVWDWNGASWVLRASSNPASLYRHVLQGTSNRRPLADGRVDLATLQTWHGECSTAGREFNAVFRSRSEVHDVLRMVCLAGRATFDLPDGKSSVVRDIAQTVPIAHFTPRNSYGVRTTRTFVRLPDGFEIPFLDEDNDWQEVRMKVVRPGVSEASASDFDRFDLPGVTNATQLRKEALYHLAVLVTRAERTRWGADFEQLELRRGDLVALTSDVLQHGIAAGRVLTVTTDGGGNCTAIELDETCDMEASKNYGVSIRKASGTPITRQVTTVAGANNTLTFVTPIPAAQPHPAVDDLVQFGLHGSEYAEYILDKKAPNAEMGATLEALPAAPSVHTADQGTIQAFDPQITQTPALPLRAPPPPRLSRVRPFISRARAASGRDGGGAVEIVLDSGGTQDVGGAA